LTLENEVARSDQSQKPEATFNLNGEMIEKSLGELRIEEDTCNHSNNEALETDAISDYSYDFDKQKSESSQSCRCNCHETTKRTRSESTRTFERNKDKRLLILDARSFTVAFFNRAMGGGSECAEYYPSCDVDYLYLANIHSVRNAFLSLRSISENNALQFPH
jgi:hypothetical protein